MKNKNLIAKAILSALLVFLYVVIVGLFMFNGGAILGQITNFWGSVVILMLFVFSAGLVGFLVLGMPVHLYLSGEKRNAIKLLIYTLLVLFVFLILVVICLVFNK